MCLPEFSIRFAKHLQVNCWLRFRRGHVRWPPLATRGCCFHWSFITSVKYSSCIYHLSKKNAQQIRFTHSHKLVMADLSMSLSNLRWAGPLTSSMMTSDRASNLWMVLSPLGFFVMNSKVQSKMALVLFAAAFLGNEARWVFLRRPMSKALSPTDVPNKPAYKWGKESFTVFWAHSFSQFSYW